MKVETKTKKIKCSILNALRRRLFRTVRRFSPVDAPQVGTYCGAQDYLSIDPIKNPISIKKTKVNETLRIATFNCKGAKHISG